MSSETSFPLGPLSPREQNRDIVWMMLPLLAVSCYLYGARPAVMCLVGSITAAFCDRLVAWLRGRPHDRTENSSIPAVLVMLMLMPATLSYYIVVITSMTVVLVAKAPFGGYGHYPFNPSAVGYAVAAVSWPSQVFTYPVPFTTMSVFSTAEATMVESAAHSLQAGGTPNVRALNLVLGNYAGPMGTTALLVGMVSVSPALAAIPRMDNRGKVVVSAYAVCAGSCFAAHLGFTVGVAPEMVGVLLIVKLLGGVLGILTAMAVTRDLSPKRRAEG